MRTDSAALPAPPPRRSLFRRFLRVVLIGGGLLIILALLALIFVNAQGARAWKKFRAEWEAKGERFDLASIIPAPVPPEQNFATTPFLAPLLDLNYAQGESRWNDPAGNDRARALSDAFKSAGDKKAPLAGRWETGNFVDLSTWQTYFDGNSNFPFATPPTNSPLDVLAALKKFDPVLDELRAASARPYSVFPIHYERTFNALLPHLAVLKGVAQIVRLRALARLGAGQTDAALDDTGSLCASRNLSRTSRSLFLNWSGLRC